MNEEQNDSRNALLRPAQLVGVWGVGERQVRKLLGELEALGFRLETDRDGARLCPPGLAAAVRTCRQAKKELSVLRLDPTAARYLAPSAIADELDPLALLIFVATEVSIIREVTATAANAMTTGAAASQIRPFAWVNVGIPDPRHSL